MKMNIVLAKLLSRWGRLWRRLEDWRLAVPAARRRLRFDRVVVVEAGEGTPPLGAADALLVRSGARQKWLRFACPDDCGATIMLDLSPKRTPHWSVETHAGGAISVYPSVVNGRCGAHFLVRSNRIIWLASRNGQG